MSFEGMTKLEAIQELRALSRLHEVATERNAALAALIEAAKADLTKPVTRGMDPSPRRAALATLESADTEKALRAVRHRTLIEAAEQLEAHGLPGVAVGAPWLRDRAARVLGGVL